MLSAKNTAMQETAATVTRLFSKYASITAVNTPTIAEIVDDETEGIVWAVLSKWKGIWHFSSYYDSLEGIIEGI